jgi:hypothetical protein
VSHFDETGSGRVVKYVGDPDCLLCQESERRTELDMIAETEVIRVEDLEVVAEWTRGEAS